MKMAARVPAPMMLVHVWTWSLGGYYTRRKGLLCSASIMASKMVGESKAAQWNLVWLGLSVVLSIEFSIATEIFSRFEVHLTWHDNAIK